jgi:hypothetical protein
MNLKTTIIYQINCQLFITNNILISQCLFHALFNILCMCVTRNRVWIGNWIYWTLITVLSQIHTLCSSLQHVLNLFSLLCLHQSSGNSFERRMFPFLFLNCPRASVKIHRSTPLTHPPTNSLQSAPLHWLNSELWLAVYHQSICLGIKPLEAHNLRFFSTEPLWS